ncbi:hypothetical protein K457DRAFT_890097 [Linnemannia elongata AG-77]|uniref:Uncharacterized protein n=1 Tax=Linnemannia elongata AG-77 TaxID=1314771 RepID=A0A197K355_9FUNG|nr:hypothetical protein K457DRAFT_890097 [Linnemannia elongata AG-77]
MHGPNKERLCTPISFQPSLWLFFSLFCHLHLLFFPFYLYCPFAGLSCHLLLFQNTRRKACTLRLFFINTQVLSQSWLTFFSPSPRISPFPSYKATQLLPSMSTSSAKNLSAMSTTINLQEYREIQQREREHEQEEAFNKSHARKKSRSNAQLLSSPQPTTMYTAEDQLRRTNIAPHISASTLSTAASTATSATAIVTTSGPASPSLSTATPQQKSAQHQQILTQMQQHQHFLAQQQLLTQQQQTSPTSPTPIYTIDAFITRYAHKLQSLDHSIKGKVLTAETLKSDPLQDQRRRELYLSISSYEAKLVEYEDKIEKLFRLKICNGK